MSWTYLIIAAVFEMGWPIGIKLSQTTSHRWLALLAAVTSMALSVFFLWLAQREIPIGTAYAVWTGLGTVGVFLVGIFLFEEPSDLIRIGSVLLIIVGIVGLKVTQV